jgi:aspartate 1-decarboxylase
MRSYLHAKIHQATVTEADVEYVGSISIDRDLVEKAGMHEGERVLVVSNTTGARLETYVIPAEPGSGVIGMNGAAAHLIRVGEEIIVMAFEWSDSPPEATIVQVDADNHFRGYL